MQVLTPLEEERRRHFHDLADWWYEATDAMSSLDDKANHDAYRRIIAMGDAAVPYILEDLRDRGGHWFRALRTITGASPVPADMAGSVRLAKEAWLRWGRENGLIPAPADEPQH